MIEMHSDELIFQTTSEDQSRLLGHNIEHFKNKDEMGIRNEQICQNINFICDLQNIVQEKINSGQKKVLKDIMVFVRRCIDSIQFLKIISFQQQSDPKIRKSLFEKFMKSISTSKDGKAVLKELSYTQYKDLVLQGGSHDNLFEV